MRGSGFVIGVEWDVIDWEGMVGEISGCDGFGGVIFSEMEWV